VNFHFLLTWGKLERGKPNKGINLKTVKRQIIENNLVLSNPEKLVGYVYLRHSASKIATEI
jgi:hypothetical protein